MVGERTSPSSGRFGYDVDDAGTAMRPLTGPLIAVALAGVGIAQIVTQ